MNRSRVIRRALALTAGVALATTASLLGAQPASAFDGPVRVKGPAVCADGVWTVEWKVINDHVGPVTIDVVTIKPEDSSLEGDITEGAVIEAGESITGTQKVTGSAEKARLTLEFTYEEGSNTQDGFAELTVKLGECEDAPPSPEPTTTPEPEPSPSETVAPSPSVTPAPGEGGGLPVTGTAVGGIVAAAVALLGLGGGLFLVARRRRIRFTA